MIEDYKKHAEERSKLGIPPLPLDSKQAEQLCELIKNSNSEKEEFLLDLLKNRISPGVDPAAKVKADFFGSILKGDIKTNLINKCQAIEILGTMVGGYNVIHLVNALNITDLAECAADALSKITLVYDGFDQVLELSKNNKAAKRGQ